MKKNVIAGILVTLAVAGIVTGMVFNATKCKKAEPPKPKPKPIIVEVEKVIEEPEEEFAEEEAKEEVEESTPSDGGVDVANEEYSTSAFTTYTESDAIDLAKLMYAECRGVDSATERACVAWTVLNRADMYGMSISDVLRAPGQYAFSEDLPVDESLLSLAKDVLERWSNGTERLLPMEYIYFSGDGVKNYFRNGNGDIWDYSTESPYQY